MDIVAKHYAKHYILPRDGVKAHESGEIHYHDLDDPPFSRCLTVCWSRALRWVKRPTLIYGLAADLHDPSLIWRGSSNQRIYRFDQGELKPNFSANL